MSSLQYYIGWHIARDIRDGGLCSCDRFPLHRFPTELIRPSSSPAGALLGQWVSAFVGRLIGQTPHDKSQRPNKRYLRTCLTQCARPQDLNATSADSAAEASAGCFKQVVILCAFWQGTWYIASGLPSIGGQALWRLPRDDGGNSNHSCTVYSPSEQYVLPGAGSSWRRGSGSISPLASTLGSLPSQPNMPHIVPLYTVAAHVASTAQVLDAMHPLQRPSSLVFLQPCSRRLLCTVPRPDQAPAHTPTHHRR